MTSQVFSEHPFSISLGSEPFSILHGKFKGDVLYNEVPLVEVLPPPTGATRSLVLNALSVVVHEGTDAQVDSGPSGIGVDVFPW